MAKKSVAISSAKKIAQKLKSGKKSKSVQRYQSQGQNAPQSKAWTEANDESISAKPIGYRWTKDGASRLGKNESSKPTQADIDKYKNKTFSKGGVKHRYLYSEKRVDKSDRTRASKFEKGGGVKQTKPQSQVYKASRDKKVEAKPVGWRYKGNNYNTPSEATINREMKKDREDRKVYYETRKDKSDHDFYNKYEDGGTMGAGSFARGGQNPVGRQYPNYSEDMDGQKIAKPVGYRYTDRLAKRLGVNPHSRPSNAHIEKYLGKGVYIERRQDKSDSTPSKKYISLEYGGENEYAKGGGVKYGNKKVRYKGFEIIQHDTHCEIKGYSSMSGTFFQSGDIETIDQAKKVIDLALNEKNIPNIKDIHKRIVHYSDNRYNDDLPKYAKGGVAFGGRQYNPYNKDMDGEKTGKPVGYRYTDRLASRLGISPYKRPSKEHIDKYLGRGVYFENRQDKSDLKPTTSKTYASFEYGGESTMGAGSYARGGVERISNREAREYTENMIPFKANNLEGKTLSNGDYVVLSYGYYPIWWYCKAEGKWYGNSTKYSVTTSKQMSQSRPSYDATMLSRNDLEKKMMDNHAKYESGGVLDAMLGDTDGATLQNVGGTTFSNADLTSHMDIRNPNF